MMPRNIISQLKDEMWFRPTYKYCEYTSKVGYLTLENGNNRITFRCEYETIQDMETDMSTI